MAQNICQARIVASRQSHLQQTTSSSKSIDVISERAGVSGSTLPASSVSSHCSDIGIVIKCEVGSPENHCIDSMHEGQTIEDISCSPSVPHSTPIHLNCENNIHTISEICRSPSPCEDIASLLEASITVPSTETTDIHTAMQDVTMEPISTSTPKHEQGPTSRVARQLTVGQESQIIACDATNQGDDRAMRGDSPGGHALNITQHDPVTALPPHCSALPASVPALRVGFMAEQVQLSAPLVGYEIMEQRSKFTIYKINVHRNRDENWFIFRRYNDFVRLNDQLLELFPHFRLALPSKRIMGDNFEAEFLDARMQGLRAFLSNVTSHREVSASEPVRKFLCLDEPPGPHDSLEESRAQCTQLEEKVYSLQRSTQEKDAAITLLEEELALHRAEIDNLRKSLRFERALNASRGRDRSSLSASSHRSDASLAELDETEADQALKQNMKDRRGTSIAADILHNLVVTTAQVHIAQDKPHRLPSNGTHRTTSLSSGNSPLGGTAFHPSSPLGGNAFHPSSPLGDSVFHPSSTETYSHILRDSMSLRETINCSSGRSPIIGRDVFHDSQSGVEGNNNSSDRGKASLRHITFSEEAS